MNTQIASPDGEFLRRAFDAPQNIENVNSPSPDTKGLDIRVLIRLYSLFNPSITQSQIADLLDVPLISISRILSGTAKDHKKLSYEKLSRLSDNVDCDLLRSQIDIIERMQSNRSGDEAKTELEILYGLRNSNGVLNPLASNSVLSYDPIIRKGIIDEYKARDKMKPKKETITEFILVSTGEVSDIESVAELVSRFETKSKRKEILCHNNNYFPTLLIYLQQYCTRHSNDSSFSPSEEIYALLIKGYELSFQTQYMVYPEFKEIISE